VTGTLVGAEQFGEDKRVSIYTAPPVTAFIVLTIVGMLIIGLAPLAMLSVYDKAEVTSPQSRSRD